MESVGTSLRVYFGKTSLDVSGGGSVRSSLRVSVEPSAGHLSI